MDYSGDEDGSSGDKMGGGGLPDINAPCTLAQEVEEQKRLSTQERLRLAKRRRAEQLKRWAAREREWKKAGHIYHFFSTATEMDSYTVS